MHAAERALLFAKRDIALDQPWIEAVRFELPQAPDFERKSLGRPGVFPAL